MWNLAIEPGQGYGLELEKSVKDSALAFSLTGDKKVLRNKEVSY